MTTVLPSREISIRIEGRRYSLPVAPSVGEALGVHKAHQHSNRTCVFFPNWHIGPVMMQS